MLAAIIKKISPKFGAYVVSIDYAGQFAPELILRSIFSKHRIRTVLDVGANRGQFQEFMRKSCGFKERVISFEPQPDLAEKLCKLAETDSDWLIKPVGLSDTEGELEMKICHGDDLSSFLSPAVTSPAAKVVETKVVPVKTLDSYRTEIEGFCPLSQVFLKIDTQGYDLNVLRGASEILKTAPVVQTELSFQSIYKGQPPAQEVINLLVDKGFALAGMTPTSRLDDLTVPEFDGIFVKKHLKPL